MDDFSSTGEVWTTSPRQEKSVPLESRSIHDVHVNHKAPLKSMAASWLPEAGWPWAALWLPEAAAGGGVLHRVCDCSAAFTSLGRGFFQGGVGASPPSCRQQDIILHPSTGAVSRTSPRQEKYGRLLLDRRNLDDFSSTGEVSAIGFSINT